jgi:hypothetical protein
VNYIFLLEFRFSLLTILWVFIIVDALNSRSRAVKDEPISSILCKSPIQFAIQSSLDAKDEFKLSCFCDCFLNHILSPVG